MDRYFFGFPSPNVAGLAIAFLGMCAATACGQGRRVLGSRFLVSRRGITIALLFVTGILVGMTGSRAASLALVIACVGTICWGHLHWTSMLVILIPLSLTTIGDRLDGIPLDPSVTNRFEVWSSGVQIMFDNLSGMPISKALEVSSAWHFPVGYSPELLGYLSDPVTNMVRYGIWGFVLEAFIYSSLLAGWISLLGDCGLSRNFGTIVVGMTVFSVCVLFQYHSYYWSFFFLRTFVSLLVVGCLIFIRREGGLLVISTICFFVFTGLALYVHSLCARHVHVVYHSKDDQMTIWSTGGQLGQAVSWVASSPFDRIQYSQNYGRFIIECGVTLIYGFEKAADSSLLAIIQYANDVNVSVGSTVALLDPIAEYNAEGRDVMVFSSDLGQLGRAVWGREYSAYGHEVIILGSSEDAGRDIGGFFMSIKEVSDASTE